MLYCIQYASARKQFEFGLQFAESWQERVTRELDSTLDAWVDSIPEHRRSPHTIFAAFFSLCVQFVQCAGTHTSLLKTKFSLVRHYPFDYCTRIYHLPLADQSAALYCAYFHTRILIHRTSITDPAVSDHPPPSAISPLRRHHSLSKYAALQLGHASMSPRHSTTAARTTLSGTAGYVYPSRNQRSKRQLIHSWIPESSVHVRNGTVAQYMARLERSGSTARRR
jgi:hypothetical protein